MDTEKEAEPRFRAVKRRRFTRKRDEYRDEADSAAQHVGSPSSAQSEDETSKISELLRTRKASKSRWNGVSFTNTSRITSENGSCTPNESLPRQDAEAERFTAITDRFVPHTGQTVDVDKHMIEYIEFEMAKRRIGTPTTDPNAITHEKNSLSSREGGDIKPFAQRQPVSLGRIQEIDLGQDTSLKNARRTEMAIRKQNGETVVEEEAPPPKRRKPRIGRDGKPMRPRRGPKRRNSEDVQRDKLVEEILRETKLDIYDDPSGESSDDDDDNELEADERVAEQFKQDFMEAMQSRKRTRTSGQPKPPGALGSGRPGESTSRGPKLGGSRNARAAMRERELQQQKGKK